MFVGVNLAFISSVICRCAALQLQALAAQWLGSNMEGTKLWKTKTQKGEKLF